MSADEARAVRLARGAVIGQVLFTAGWLIGSILQDDAYSSARHDLSDLGALTAQYPWVLLIPQGLAGALTILFALGALRPAFRLPQRGEAVGPWLVALSALGLGSVSDFFFRIDCRAADVGCSQSAAIASWPGTIHATVGIFTALVTVLAPFTLARRMRHLAKWRDLASGAVAFGLVALSIIVLYLVLHEAYGGFAQRAGIFQASVGLLVLASRIGLIAESRFSGP
jgi:hypothetical protein